RVVLFQDARQPYRSHQALHLSLQSDESCSVERALHGYHYHLETVSQQGYRFRVAGDTDEPPPLTAGPIVGRQPDVEVLESWIQRAIHGTRHLVFVSGDVGIGKTRVVDLFLARCAAASGVWIGRGQCVEHYGEGEPYLPFLEALWQLTHSPA